MDDVKFDMFHGEHHRLSAFILNYSGKFCKGINTNHTGTTPTVAKLFTGEKKAFSELLTIDVFTTGI